MTPSGPLAAADLAAVPGWSFYPGQLWQGWTYALRNLSLHPLRSLLTILGIFIGVASVVWLLAIGDGISASVQRQIESLGAENIILRSIRVRRDMEQKEGFTPPVYGVTRTDLARLRETLATVRHAVPVREQQRTLRFAGRKIDGRLVGCTTDYAQLVHLQLDRGRFLAAADSQQLANVCVLAAEVAAELFPYEEPLGRNVRVDNHFFTVVGTLEPKTASAGIGGSLAAEDFSHDLYIPLETFWNRLGDMQVTIKSGSYDSDNCQLSQVTLQVDRADHVLATADVVKATLAQFHKEADYSVTIPLELLEQARTTKLMFMVLIGVIAGISLLVGGIGIMNIMLATVTERTREIGIRRALGAKQRDIIRQFLIETTALSIAGGGAGIVGGLLCGPAVRMLRGALLYAAPQAMSVLPEAVRTLEPQLVPWSIPLAFGISVGVGITFGLYPAIRAARLDPIEALRRE